MRLTSFVHGSENRFGLVAKDGVIDCTGKFGPDIASLRHLLEKGAIQQLRELSDREVDPVIPLDEIRFLPPVVEPQKIICVGVNYPGRSREIAKQAPPPQFPNLFYRSPHSFVGHGGELVRPAVSEQLDYECEFALIIGRAGRHVAPEDSLQHVAGITLCNEGTVADWCKHGTFNVTQGKNFDRSGSMGPWMVTLDELDLESGLDIETRINGELRQSDISTRMVFDFAFLISYISAFATLQPGDVIVTGTPIGNGKSFDPPRWLKPGDVCEITSPHIGTLRNTVVAEPENFETMRFAVREGA